MNNKMATVWERQGRRNRWWKGSIIMSVKASGEGAKGMGGGGSEG